MIGKTLIYLRVLALVFFASCILGDGSAKAVTITPSEVLPNAVSYEYFGLNFAMNERTSNSVGTLTYTGQPGCGGTCEATTTLGADPSASVTVNEVTYMNTAGGSAQADLGYYVAYLNSPGIYTVDLHALDSFNISDGTYAFTHLKIGIAGTDTTSFNNFDSTTFEETQCFNGCPSSTPAGATALPFPANTDIQMQANTLYFIQIDALINGAATGVEDTATVDPTFSTNMGGSFAFSPGVSSSGVTVVPLPASWALFICGVGFLGAVKRLRKVTVVSA